MKISQKYFAFKFDYGYLNSKFNLNYKICILHIIFKFTHYRPNPLH